MVARRAASEFVVSALGQPVLLRPLVASEHDVHPACTLIPLPAVAFPSQAGI